MSVSGGLGKITQFMTMCLTAQWQMLLISWVCETAGPRATAPWLYISDRGHMLHLDIWTIRYKAILMGVSFRSAYSVAVFSAACYIGKYTLILLVINDRHCWTFIGVDSNANSKATLNAYNIWITSCFRILLLLPSFSFILPLPILFCLFFLPSLCQQSFISVTVKDYSIAKAFDHTCIAQA